MMKITVDTEQYEFAHGHSPRGRGTWHFEVTYSTGDGRYMDGVPVVVHFASFGEALREARMQARDDAPGGAKVATVTVGS